MPTISSASVRVMRSYNYNHFEVSLTSNDVATQCDVDTLRKQAQRLADKAVSQFQIAERAVEAESWMQNTCQLRHANETPENERTPSMKAIIKYHSDVAFASRFHYDYEEDYEPYSDDDDQP